MGRGKDLFIEMTGGYRLGESDDEFRARVAEINRLEQGLKTGQKLEFQTFEQLQRHLCELKGIDFDEYDDPEEDYS